MERRVQIILQTLVILCLFGITSQAQPVQVTQVPGTSTNFTDIGDLVYFTVGNALWRTDGTAQGTFELKTGFTGFSEFTEFNGKLFFRSGKTPETGQVAWNELWASNGTSSGTVLLKKSSSYDINIAGTTNSYLFFAASDPATGLELYRSNGTVAGTTLVKDLFPGTSNGFRFSSAGVGNLLFFAGNNGTSGTELWKSDGTSAGTVMVEDINPGSGNGMGGDVISYNNLFYFRGNNGVNGPEPWVSDGSGDGTSMLKDIIPGSAGTSIQYGIGNNGSVYFLVWPVNYDPDASAPDLWRSSGTAASTIKVQNVGYPENSDEYYNFLTYQDKVYFIQRMGDFSDTFWKSDGTPEGTNTFYSLEDTWNDGITFFDVVKDHVLFTGISQGYAFPLFRHDGTRTDVAYRFNSSGFNGGSRSITAPHIEKAGNLAFFADHEGNPNDGGAPSTEADYFHLFQTDGVTTQSMRTLYGVNITGVKHVSDFNGKVIFTTHDDYFAPFEDFQRLWIYDPSAPPNTGAGKLSVETWNGISGTQVSSIPVNSPPSSTSEITIFETPKNIGDNYGSRVRGYVVPPATGNYTFWISSDDRSELWLSTDESAANRRRIAYVNGWTSQRQWDKYSTQRSAAISLMAGRRYYIEALLKEGTGGDHLAVGWQLPGGALERPIPGNRLIPFESAPTTTGKIDIETWTGISGTNISSIPVDSPPNFESELTIFETPRNVGDNYGSRVRGYIHVPTTGSYTFWIASDDRSELWLSTDENPTNKVRIAYVSGWTYSRQWDKYASQRSASISLVGGRKYYIEALLKEGTGGDHLAVGWQLPGGALERPIPGSRLSEFEMNSEATARRTETTEQETLFSQLNIYPNPVQSGEPELRMGGYENISQTIDTQVEIINMTGEVIYSDEVRCGGDCSSYLIKVHKQLVPGVYLVNLKTNGTWSSKRLLVK